MNIFRIDSSPLKEVSASRQLLNVLQSKLDSQGHSLTGNRDPYYNELVSLGTQDLQLHQIPGQNRDR